MILPTNNEPVEFVPVSRFAVDGTEPAASFEEARAFVSPFFELQLTDETRGDVDAYCISYLAGNVVFEESSFGPMALSRGPARGFEAARETVTVWLMLSGSHKGVADETSFCSRTGEIHLLDSRCSLSVVAERRKIAALHFPHSALGFDPRRHPPHLSLPANSAAARVLATTMQESFAVLPRASQAEAAVIADGIAALIRGLFRFDSAGRPEPDTVNTARARAAHAWLDAHLLDQTLGVDSLCREFNVSRTTVYRAFEKDGGVAAYLRRKRLERAYRELMTAPATRGHVREVAERWGFIDPGHFSRCFRQQFGFAPSSVPPRTDLPKDGEKLPGDGAKATVSPVFHWLACG